MRTLTMAPSSSRTLLIDVVAETSTTRRMKRYMKSFRPRVMVPNVSVGLRLSLGTI